MSNLIVSRLDPADTTGKIAATIDDADFPGERVAGWVEPGDVGLVSSPGDVTAIEQVTQAEYDALSPPTATTLYVIVG